MRRMKGLAVAVLALPLLAMTGTSEGEWRSTDGGWVSGPVEYVRNIPTETAGSSAVLHRQRLYVTTLRSFSIYDVRDALDPKLLSSRQLGPHAFNEQPDTNGRILLLSNDFHEIRANVAPLQLAAIGSLEVWDVRDAENPSHLASLPMSKREHMWTCVHDCEFAYAAGGAIVDLSEPAAPRIVGDWTDLLPEPPSARQIHAIEEVAPGLVLTGGVESYLLDAREDPTQPTFVARVDHDLDAGVPGRVDWPGAPNGRWALVSVETPLSGDCNARSGGFRTYDTSGWQESGTFVLADEYALRDGLADGPGTYSDGRSAHHVFGCGAYSFDVPEHFTETGLVTVAWFEDGMRLLQVGDDGSIAEVGGFLPLGGVSAKPIWRNDEVVYLVDIYRGIDILRIDVDD